MSQLDLPLHSARPIKSALIVVLSVGVTSWRVAVEFMVSQSNRE
jgi:hypothetical protein